MAPGLEGQRITRVCFDYAVSLWTESGFELRFETAFVIRAPNAAETLVEPDRPGETAAEVLTLLHRVVEVASVRPAGRLTVAFVDGHEVEARANSKFEAWALIGPHGARTVCGPGGGISEWSPTA